MFAATLMFCLHTAVAAPNCGGLNDTRGPFKTEQECKARLVEMSAQFDAFLRSRGFRGTAQTKATCKKLVKGIGV